MDQYNTIRKTITKDNRTATQFLDHLELPKFNPKENPKQIKIDLLNKKDDDEFEKEKAEAERKREDIKRRL